MAKDLPTNQAGARIGEDEKIFLATKWLPDMDLNHDKQIQSLLCYRYTIGQAGTASKLSFLGRESSD